METNTNTPEAKQPASAGCHPTPCSACTDAGKYTEPHGSKERVEEQLRIALDGHHESELWGEHGLIAATMRCVYGYEKMEEALRRIAAYSPDTMSGFECREIACAAISLPNVCALAQPRETSTEETDV